MPQGNILENPQRAGKGIVRSIERVNHQGLSTAGFNRAKELVAQQYGIQLDIEPSRRIGKILAPLGEMVGLRNGAIIYDQGGNLLRDVTGEVARITSSNYAKFYSYESPMYYAVSKYLENNQNDAKLNAIFFSEDLYVQDTTTDSEQQRSDIILEVLVTEIADILKHPQDPRALKTALYVQGVRQRIRSEYPEVERLLTQQSPNDELPVDIRKMFANTEAILRNNRGRR